MSTPGPWHANLTTTRINVSSKTASIAHLIHCDAAARADAVLIAAAPAMLAALRIARSALAGNDEALEQIDAAINAAEGR